MAVTAHLDGEVPFRQFPFRLLPFRQLAENGEIPFPSRQLSYSFFFLVKVSVSLNQSVSQSVSHNPLPLFKNSGQAGAVIVTGADL